MAQFTFRLPDIGEGVAEAEIVVWHVKVGDLLEEDQPLVDVMTDKATVEMTTPVSGRVLATHGEIGEVLPVGSVLVELETGVGDKVAAPSPVMSAPSPRSARPAAAPRTPADVPLAAPATRHRAFELGIPLQFVPATGPGGRVTPDDLNAYIARGGKDGGTGQAGSRGRRTGVHETRLVGLRRKIAEHMQEAARRIPHFGYVEEFDLTELEGLRRELNTARTGDQPKLTLLPFFIRALVKTLPAFPQINALYDDVDGVLRTHEAIHVGIATQTPGGLMVPVVRHAEARDLWDCARELGRVTAAARDGNTSREELTGSTITLTSLGAIGGIAATPIINRPEVAIIGPNKLVERPVAMNGQVSIRTMMNLSSSFDHRIVDGYDAALFVQALKRLIERPALLFVEGT